MTNSAPLPATLERITLRHAASQSELDIYPFGATITAWRSRQAANRSAKDIFFLSERADLSGKQAIRGGIPIIFPQFKARPDQTHGFARTAMWNILKRSEDSITLRFSHTSTGVTNWPHPFTFDYEVTLSESLRTELIITNTGATEFSFQCALHTYFAVSHIDEVTVAGLAGLTYTDKVARRENCTEASSAFAFTQEVDRIYFNAPDRLVLRDKAHAIILHKTNFPDAVVWNPWSVKASEMKDLKPDDYQRFVCVEAGAIAQPIRLAPHGVWRASQLLSVSS